MLGSKLGLRGSARVGKSGMGLRVRRMGLELLSVCLLWSGELGCAVRKARGLEVGLRVGVRRGACVGVHWRWQGDRRWRHKEVVWNDGDLGVLGFPLY